MRQLPNAISIGRLLLAPLVIAAMAEGHPALALWLFCLAAFSDALDGILARCLKARSALGSYLDPLADKVLLVGVYLALAAKGLVWPWLAGLIALRDVGLATAALLLHRSGAQDQVAPLLVSKLNTLVQIGFAGLVLGRQGYGLWPDLGLSAPALLVAATTLASLAAYLAQGRRHFVRGE